MPIFSAAGAGMASGAGLPATTVALVALSSLPGELLVASLSYSISTSVTPVGANVVRLGLYSEDGQRRLINVTDASGVATGVRKLAISPALLLMPGHYYVAACIDTAGATPPRLNLWSQTGGVDLCTLNPPSGEPVLEGELTIVAGALPPTFDPTSLTPNFNRCPVMRFDS